MRTRLKSRRGLTEKVLMRTDERKNKKREGSKSQPGDGEKHEGRKGGCEALSACVVDIKDIGHEAFV